MKKLATLFFCCVMTQGLFAQKCLDINILSLMAQYQVPGGAATAFGNCQTTKNEQGQLVITSYGTQYDQLDQTVKSNTEAFSVASMPTMSAAGISGSSQVKDAQALATKLQSMSPDERKAYVMQMATQMQASYMQSNTMSESPAAARLVMATQSIIVTQLTPLQNEFDAKYRDLLLKEKSERDSVPTPKYNSCPGVDKTGLPACGCVNALDGAYWQHIVAIEDSYNGQKTALLQSYLPRVKALIGQVEDNIAKLHGGDDVKSPNFKKILFSTQSSAFGIGFAVLGSAIQDIQKASSDVYVNKANCDAMVYNLSCSHQ